MTPRESARFHKRSKEELQNQIPENIFKYFSRNLYHVLSLKAVQCKLSSSQAAKCIRFDDLRSVNNHHSLANDQL